MAGEVDRLAKELARLKTGNRSEAKERRAARVGAAEAPLQGEAAGGTRGGTRGGRRGAKQGGRGAGRGGAGARHPGVISSSGGRGGAAAAAAVPCVA